MICSVKRAVTYVEKEPTVDRLAVGGVGEVDTQLVVLQSQGLEVQGVELLVAWDVDWAEVPVCEELLPPAECVTQELHRAVVVGRKVQLALDRQDDVEVLLRLDEVP